LSVFECKFFIVLYCNPHSRGVSGNGSAQVQDTGTAVPIRYVTRSKVSLCLHFLFIQGFLFIAHIWSLSIIKTENWPIHE